MYHARRDLFCDLLESELDSIISFEKPSGGLAVWTTFDERIPVHKLAAKCQKLGLEISDGSHFQPHANANRLGFGSTNETEILQGMEILKNQSKPSLTINHSFIPHPDNRTNHFLQRNPPC